ncbi:LysR family transcriptional regulator [Sphingomonas histidinilytica]|jgi:DNA-binding transcriptional LysR family regulator|uniref:DNA-binding transcriptional regulator, LysR family n=1 Tax=Rhizorhabdus histidinilytica TaxID=439228 RepID=A0A1T5FHK6_9SPHN|nr:LysR family transcriptional regulator [Rhizorhabdus histidinilytica]MBO9375619.1 LysR family transcriptional regulator [Rhizorhabdus histidinilytica]QEH81062.1 LysR family transcriptional regulator [Sphingomonas sp. C8-2]SKB95582.1 DNA-binding transcriptional regulator, LysR family [Rhizorhabdus histidinilytica]
MISSERLNGIRAFVQAELSGSFARAADRLGLSQSAVSKAVARMEERLGVRLFHRTTRHLSLTDEGRAYYQSCVRALAELEAAEAALADRKRSPSGCLRVNLPDLFGRKWVMPILFDLARDYPQLTFEISFENRFVDLAEEGYDLVVRIGALSDSLGLIARKIGFQDLVICGAPDYFAKAPPPASAAALADHACITHFSRGREEAWAFRGDAGDLRRLSVRSRHRFGSFDTIADAVRAGLGIAQLPTWLVHEDLAEGRLVPILLDVAQPRLPIHALWLESRGMTPRVRVTVDALVARLGSIAAL